MRSEPHRRRIDVKTSLVPPLPLAIQAMLVVCSVVSCGSDRNEIDESPLRGGPAVVLRDASALDGGGNGGHGGIGGMGGHGGIGGRGGVGGFAGRGAAGSAPSGGAAGTGGSVAMGGVTGTGGVGGGANGGAPVVDPCRACELRRCTKPQNDDGNLDIAYDLCFLDQPVPTTPPEIHDLCGGDSYAGRVTSAGDHPGTPKTDLCHAVLACIARTKCAGAYGTDDFASCYCGAGVTPQQCQQVTFVPQGKCAAEMAAGYEATSNADITAHFYNACLSSGAATNAYLGCYEPCCSKECLGIDPPPDVDDSSCNAPAASTGGTTGMGGTPATGGATGAAGRGGATGTGGTVSTGGSGGGVAAGGHAGGTAGAAGSGAAGAGGGAPPPTVSRFDGTTTPWTASYGSFVNYSTSDAAGSTTSGSLDLTLINGNASLTSIVAATECVSVVAGSTYDLSAHIFIPQQMSGTLAGLGLWFYASNDCSSAASTTFSSPQVAVVGSWQALSTSTAVPAGTQSLSVRLTATKPAGKTAAEALFDDVSVTKR